MVGPVTDGYSKPSAGQMNAYNNGTPSNMTDFVNFRISQFDQSGAARVIPVQRDWDSGTGLYDSVTTATTLTMYQKTNDSSLSSYEIVGQYLGTLYYKTQSNPPSATSPQQQVKDIQVHTLSRPTLPTTGIFKLQIQERYIGKAVYLLVIRALLK